MHKTLGCESEISMNVNSVTISIFSQSIIPIARTSVQKIASDWRTMIFLLLASSDTFDPDQEYKELILRLARNTVHYVQKFIEQDRA